MTSLAENLIPVKNLRPPTTRYRKGVKVPSLNMLKRGKQNKKLGDKVTVKKVERHDYVLINSRRASYVPY